MQLQLVKSLKSVFRRKRRNPDRVYVFDPDVEEFNYRKSWFLRFYSALGCISLPKPQKYYPEFTDVFQEPLRPKTPAPPVCESCTEFDESDIELIELGDDILPVESEGEQEDPLHMIIAWEYPEEQMPVFHYLGYGYN